MSHIKPLVIGKTSYYAPHQVPSARTPKVRYAAMLLADASLWFQALLLRAGPPGGPAGVALAGRAQGARRPGAARPGRQAGAPRRARLPGEGAEPPAGRQVCSKLKVPSRIGRSRPRLSRWKKTIPTRQREGGREEGEGGVALIRMRWYSQ